MGPSWFLPILASALALGFYDVCKKHAVRDNSVMPVLFLSSLFSALSFWGAYAFSGRLSNAFSFSIHFQYLVLLKSLLVASSWTCVYYAMRDLPISIAAPIRASAPLWTFFGGLFLYHEVPSWFQGFSMLFIFAGYLIFSLVGKAEGFSFSRHRGIPLIFLGTLFGAASALYDKFLLNCLHIPSGALQLYFTLDIALVLGCAWLIRRFVFRHGIPFHFRWSIPATGILLALADFLYFYAVSLPDIQISVLSLVRRCGVIVSFAFGAWFFHDQHIRVKSFALFLILLGVLLLALVH